MKSPARIVAWVLPWLLSGCFWPLHKKQPPPPPPLAPKIETNSNTPPPSEQPPPVVMIPTKPQVSDTKLPVETPKPPPRRKKAQAAPAETQQAAAAEPSVSAIGQLTSGDPAESRRQTEASIAETEKGLNGLNRQLGDQEQKTAAHIREFIKQAKAALASGDLDGASTLAAKAKVLLAELTH